MRSHKRVLVAWWGSFPRGEETIGDLYALAHVCKMLRKHDAVPLVASISTYSAIQDEEIVDWSSVQSDEVDLAVFVCGPLIGDATYQQEFFRKFSDVGVLAVGVSLLASGLEYLPKTILPRDLPSGFAYGDLACFPVRQSTWTGRFARIGVCLRGEQLEYGELYNEHVDALRVANDLCQLAGAEMVILDTRLHGAFDAACAVEESFRSVQMLVTTRMHAGLLGISRGIPTFAMDQVPGGAKVRAVVGDTGLRVHVPSKVTASDLREFLEFAQSEAHLANVAAIQDRYRKRSERALRACESEIVRLLGLGIV